MLIGNPIWERISSAHGFEGEDEDKLKKVEEDPLEPCVGTKGEIRANKLARINGEIRATSNILHTKLGLARIHRVYKIIIFVPWLNSKVRNSEKRMIEEKTLQIKTKPPRRFIPSIHSLLVILKKFLVTQAFLVGNGDPISIRSLFIFANIFEKLPSL